MTTARLATPVRFNFGDVPTWISALASIMALIAAALAGYFTYRTYRIESGRDEVDAQERRSRDNQIRQAQASLVSAWLEDVPTDPKAPIGTVRVTNGSNSPVYHVNLGIVGDRQEIPQSLSLTVLPPTREALNLRLPVEIQPKGLRRNPGPRVQITFTDASGERWLRNRFGRLSSLAKNLQIWSGDDIENALTQFKEDFRLGYGLDLKYQTSVAGDALRKRFLREADSPSGYTVDVLVAPHDWLGELIDAGLIQPVPAPAGDVAEGLARRARRELTRGHVQFGIPTTIDTVILLRNKTLTPDVPSTFESLIETGRQLRDSRLTSRVASVSVGRNGDPFAMWPVFSGMGGSLFELRSDGTWNEDIVKINDEATIEAFRLLAELGAPDLRVFDPEVDQAEARRLFFNGQSPFLFDVYGATRHRDFANIDVGYSKIPPVRGKKCSGFYSVYAFYIALNGRNRQIAEDFVPHYLERADVAQALSEGLSSVVVSGHSIIAANDAAKVTLRACFDSVPMPSFRQMPEVWRALGDAEVSAIRGENPREVAERAAIRIRHAFVDANPTA